MMSSMIGKAFETKLMRIWQSAFFVLALLLVGCASSDPRIHILPNSRVTAEAPRIDIGEDKLLRITVSLVNKSDKASKLFYSIDWYDARGQRYESSVGARAPIAVPAYGSEDIRAVAPNPIITDFKIRVETRE